MIRPLARPRGRARLRELLIDLRRDGGRGESLVVPLLDLHRFAWVEDRLIGELPLEWNWLVGEYAFNPAAKIAHYTLGGPYFEEYRSCDYADEWFAERRQMK